MPAALKRFLRRLVNALRSGPAEDDLSRELASHVLLLEDEYRRRGMSAEQARRAARLAFGGLERTKELQRAARRFAWLDDGLRDSRYAVRLLHRNPVLALTAAVSLAIGIGANTAIFTVANALLFRAPAGVTEAQRLVDIGVSREDGGFNPGSYPAYLDIRRRATALDGVYARQTFPQAVSLGVAAASERVFGEFVTLNYFTVLGTPSAAGRLFGAVDSEQPGASPVAVLHHRFWTRRFNSDRAVVGRTIRINGHPFTVVGVAPEGFQGTGVFSGDVWLPLNMIALVNSQPETIFADRSRGWLVIGGRLKPGIPMASAAAEVGAIGRDLDRDSASSTGPRELRVVPSSSVPGNRKLVATFFVLLMGIVSLVLLVACANVSGILLARAAARRREIAVRLALGAGRGRLVRQLLMETVIVFVLGGAAGLLLARVLTTVFVPLLPSLPFPIAVSLALDGRVIAFTGGLSLMAALLSGLAPALQASKADVVAALKDESQGPSRRSRLRHAFVVAQVALSIVLIVSAGLFVRALARAGAASPGFDPRGVELASLDLQMAGFTDVTGRRFTRELVDRVRQLPGVEAATLAKVLPGGFEGIGLDGFTVPGNPDAFAAEVDWNVMEPGYFATLRIPLVAGRDFSDADRDGAQPVVIVSEGAARRFWPGQDAVGKYMSQEIRSPNDPKTKVTRAVLVIGVAGDIRASSLIDGLSNPFVYLPLQQQSVRNTMSDITLAVRTTDGRPVADAIRALVRSMNPNLSIVRSQTLEDSVALGLVPQRVAASVSASLGIVGLALAAIGIYGVTAYAVTRRTREFGVRIALGATPADIVGMVLRQGVWLIAIGCAIGLSLGAAVAQVLTVFLLGVPPLDPVTFLGSTALFAVVGLAACYGPARQATKVDPVLALRRE